MVNRIINKIKKEIWKIANIRPDNLNFHWNIYPNSIEEEQFKIATTETAEYVNKKMSNLKGSKDPFEMTDHCISQANPKGLFLEFGIAFGNSINHIASKINTIIHGFDSFKGLPEPWEDVKKGAFSTEGKLPRVRKNVRLYVGEFKDALPKFIQKHNESVSFLHVDSDLYSSAQTILYSLHNQIKKGTIIIFDEYFNYPNWQKHEYKAFQEFVKKFKKEYEYIGYSKRGYSVGIRIL